MPACGVLAGGGAGGVLKSKVPASGVLADGAGSKLNNGVPISGVLAGESSF